MTKVVMITKAGTVKTETIKNVNLQELYKKCKFRKATDFEKRHTWKYENKWVSVYSKDTGRANSENKYDLPPPIDKDLYFGNLLIIMHNNEIPKDDEVCDISKEIWLKVYEKLFGGFDDLCEEEESEEEVIPEHFKTKEGYSKEDGFIVDDEEEDEDFVCPSEEESCEDTESGDEDDDDDDDAKYGCETDEEELNEDDDDDEDELSDDDPTSELSEEEYSY
jgi:hypothetical protein